MAEVIDVKDRMYGHTGRILDNIPTLFGYWLEYRPRNDRELRRVLRRAVKNLDEDFLGVRAIAVNECLREYRIKGVSPVSPCSPMCDWVAVFFELYKVGAIVLGYQERDKNDITVLAAVRRNVRLRKPAPSDQSAEKITSLDAWRDTRARRNDRGSNPAR